jgi:molybdate transport system substrate-binding protein
MACMTAGCSSPSDASDNREPRGTVKVFAAASLTDAFSSVKAAFEEAYPDIKVKMTFAGSQSLRTQIQHGAEPQVFASANSKHMVGLAEHGLVHEPVVFAHNTMVVAVPASNPAGIESLADLPNAESLVLADANVPAGTYARQVFDRAAADYGDDFAKRVDDTVVSREMHVRQTLQKVVLGEADACVVYSTDAVAAGDRIKSIAIAPEHNVTAKYPMALVKDVSRTHLGEMFMDFVTSDAGQAALAGHGFSPVGRAAIQ